MPIDRTMSVSLTDKSRRVIVSFRRSGSQVFVDTWVDGVAHESAVSAADLQQLSTFLGDLATTRWSEVPGTTASSPASERTEPTAPAGVNYAPNVRPTSLPPYPQAARWVPAPSGGMTGNEGQHSE